MKKIKRLIPILTVAATAATITPIMVSCSKTKNVNVDNILIGFARTKLISTYHEAVSRQPEAEEVLTTVYDSFLEYIDSNKSGHACFGAALMGAGALEGIARQPEAASKILLPLKEVFDLLKENSEYMAPAFGISSGALSEAIARQPEAEHDLTENFKITCNEIQKSKSYDEAAGIGIVGSQASESIARQPEAYRMIVNAHKTAISYCHKIANNNSANTISSITAINSSSEDNGATDNDVILLMALSTGRAVHIGQVGYATCEAIARQPEAEPFVAKSAVEWYQMIYEIDSTEKSAFLSDFGYDVIEGMARQPEIAKIMMFAQNQLRRWYPKATAENKIDIESVAELYGEGFTRQPGNQTIEVNIATVSTLGKVMEKIVKSSSDISHKINIEFCDFIYDIRSYDGEEPYTLEEYESLEKQFLEYIDSFQ